MGPRHFWRTLLDPRGRRGRAGFWAFTGVSLIAYLISIVLAGALQAIIALPLLVTLGIVFAVMFVASTINCIRRLHDLGHTGWWMALFTPLELLLAAGSALESEGGGSAIAGLQALLGLGLLIWFGCIAGQPGSNRFGESPSGSAEPLAA